MDDARSPEAPHSSSNSPVRPRPNATSDQRQKALPADWQMALPCVGVDVQGEYFLALLHSAGVAKIVVWKLASAASDLQQLFDVEFLSAHPGDGVVAGFTNGLREGGPDVLAHGSRGPQVLRVAERAWTNSTNSAQTLDAAFDLPATNSSNLAICPGQPTLAACSHDDVAVWQFDQGWRRAGQSISNIWAHDGAIGVAGRMSPCSAATLARQEADILDCRATAGRVFLGTQ